MCVILSDELRIRAAEPVLLDLALTNIFDLMRSSGLGFVLSGFVLIRMLMD